MLRLCKQIGGDEVGTCGVIGNHHDLSHAGWQVRCRAGGIMRHQELGGGDPGIARSE